MKKQKKKLIAIILISFTVLACSYKNDENIVSKENEIDIIKKCLSKIKENTYLVSPVYNPFEFNSFLKSNKIMDNYKKNYDYDKNKTKILDSLEWTVNDFTKIQKEINSNYLNKSNPDFLKLSKAIASQTVISFSGIQKNLVFANMIVYCNAIKKSDLNNSFNTNQKFISVFSYIFIIKDGDVKSMIVDDGINVDFVCD